MKTKLMIVAAAISAAIAGTAAAAPNVANVTQKGSLLILPEITIEGDKTTLVQIANDGDADIWVKGFYVDRLKNKRDMFFPLTKHQNIYIDVKTGRTSAGFTVPQFPTDSSSATFAGELKLWASDSAGATQLVHNHLSAKATIVDFANTTAVDYQAWAFYNRAATVAGRLALDGVFYDRAPDYLIAQIYPKGTALDLSGNSFTVNRNTLSVSSATQDLRQDYGWIVTKLDFDVWNANEVKYTNAYKCSDSTYRTDLDVGTDAAVPGILEANPMVNGSNFLRSSLGTDTALVRVHGRASTQCNKYHIETAGTPLTPATYTPSQTVGLVGVLTSGVEVGGDANVVGHSLTAAGQRNGTIVWDPQYSDTQEKN